MSETERQITELHPTLREANRARQAEWDTDGQIDLAYRGNELAGEAGEACNVIKKLERERRGIRGSRATVEQLADELADVVICCDLIAMDTGVDLDAAVEAKFNATSEKYGLTVRYQRKAPMTNDKWVEERAVALHEELMTLPMKWRLGNLTETMHATFATALQEAFERGKAEHLRCIAVLEERNETLAENCANYRAIVDTDVVRLLARLADPDEGMVEAVEPWVIEQYGNNWRKGAASLIRALGAYLTETKGKSNE